LVFKGGRAFDPNALMQAATGRIGLD